jgi:O-acetylhomoserine/O-acetylserine sulfhydrylase-like pyridoxal-dependent enzyme
VIANDLSGHPKVQRVNYSGLASSPSHVRTTELPTTHSHLTAEEQDPRGFEPQLVHPSVGLAAGNLGAGFAVAR